MHEQRERSHLPIGPLLQPMANLCYCDLVGERSWRPQDKASERRRDEEDEERERRALEIMERRGCDWVEAWALATQEIERQRAEVGATRAGRVTLSQQIGCRGARSSRRLAPGRTTPTASWSPAVMLGDRFDRLRVHTGSHADATARALGASALAIGDDVFVRDFHGIEREVEGPAAQPLRPDVHTAASSTGGTPLDPTTRAWFEQHFRRDLGDVRLHTGAEAASAARALGARAFTVGRHIVLGDGELRLDTAHGQRLLAHELAHVAQQSGIGNLAAPDGDPSEMHEHEAEQVAHAIGWGAQHANYGDLASDISWDGTLRPLAGVPRLSPSGACIQRVQLTYDDGPDAAGNTRTVLGQLNSAGARATFYLVGKRVAQGSNWRTVFDIAAAGHWLGNHAYDWNDATDNHLFLHGTSEERAQKILQTEWAIRDALIRGRDDAQRRGAWTTIPQPTRDYIEDVIAHGTGRFRTPGFRSHGWSADGNTTMAALYSVNQVMAAAGLRPLAITEVTSWGITREGVTVDPEDWRAGRTQSDVETGVRGRLNNNSDSILLHSRIGATAAATPAIVADIQARGWTFDPTAQGSIGSIGPRPGFAGLGTISNPPTHAEIAAARAFLRRGIPSYGGFLAGSVAIGIFQMAQRGGESEVQDFITEIRSTSVSTDNGPVPLANWMNANPEWRLFAGFLENWRTQQPFPRIPGVTI